MKSIRFLGLLAITMAIAFSLITPMEGHAEWWDKLGEPKYGGTLTLRATFLENFSWDPAKRMTPFGYEAWAEPMVIGDWALDRNIWSFKSMFVDVDYCRGLLVESWEQTDPSTVTFYIRKGIHWQNKHPVNGREFNAHDVQYNIDRILGNGSGFTEPNPFFASGLNAVERAIARDDYTVDFKLKSPGVMGLVQLTSFPAGLIPHEWIEQGDVQNWRNVVGTGPFIPTEVILGTSLTYKKDPDYWGRDERHPQNQLPYIDTLKVLAIPDTATAISALRTGKIDILDRLSWEQGEILAKSNPKIRQDIMPAWGPCINLRCDTKPFTDIRVRKALQIAVDRKTIAQSVYGGTVSGTPVGLISAQLKGWNAAYDQWSQEIKDEYGYDPEKSKQLLAEAGYPNGFKTNCLLGDAGNSNVLQVIKAYFKEIGVDMDINLVDAGTFRTMTWAGEYDQMTFEGKAGMSWSPAGSFTQRLSTMTSVNLTWNKDLKFDGLVNKINGARDVAEMKRLSSEADMYAIKQHWSVNLFETSSITATQPWLKGYSGENIMNAPGWARLWIDKGA